MLFGWHHRARVTSALALPTLLLVTLWAMRWTLIGEDAHIAIHWATWAINIGAWSVFAVACHRLVLTDSSVAPMGLNVGARDLKFAGWLLGAHSLYTVLLNVLVNALPSHAMAFSVLWALSVPGVYLLARVCLVLPATAVDSHLTLRSSWQLTQHNGWRLVVVISIYPWCLSMLLRWVSRHNATLGEQVAVGMLHYLAMALAVFALSIAYKAALNRNGEGGIAA